MIKIGFFLLLYFVYCLAANCGTEYESVGFIPLIDMTINDTYQGFSGSLYLGCNNPKPDHAASALIVAGEIQPLDDLGNPSISGKIGYTSIGMSNTNQEFAQLITYANSDPLKKPEVVLMNGAQGGQPAEAMIDITAAYWTSNIPNKLSGAGLTAKQVQVAWVKQTNAGPTGPFPNWAQNLESQLVDISQNIYITFPNIKIIYFSSRIYAGYATGTLNPEPYAYESGFSVKWLIDQQMDGMSTLNFNASNGLVKTGLLLWGPYLWADGTTPNSQGTTWICPDDFKDDGTHPSNPIGRIKVANMLFDHLRNDPTTFWYRSQTSTTGIIATTGVSTTGIPITTGSSSSGQQCYDYTSGSSCFADCECGGCSGEGCLPGNCNGPTRPEDSGKCSGNWQYQCACGTTTTGIATTGIATTGIATTGIATTGIATTGVATTGIATTGIATTGIATTGIATTGVATTGTGQVACSTYNGNPPGCRAACYCGYCSPLGCTEGDISGPNAGSCNGQWQFFGPC